MTPPGPDAQVASPASGHPLGALDSLFTASPEVPARTTVPATLGLLVGLGALVSSLWSANLGVAVVLAVLAVVLSVTGLARASRPGTAGGGTAALGLVAALLTGALVALRYAGVDTAVAGDLSLRPLVDQLAALLPTPPV